MVVVPDHTTPQRPIKFWWASAAGAASHLMQLPKIVFKHKKRIEFAICLDFAELEPMLRGLLRKQVLDGPRYFTPDVIDMVDYDANNKNKFDLTKEFYSYQTARLKEKDFIARVCSFPPDPGLHTCAQVDACKD